MNTDALRKKTMQQLRVLAKQKGVKGVSRLRKEALIARLVEDVPRSSPSTSQPSHAQTTSARRARKQQRTSTQVSDASHTPAPTDQPSGTVAGQPAYGTRGDAGDPKFFLGPADQFSPTPAPELPSTYDDNRLVLLARDPHWLYAYWDFSVEQMSTVQTRLGGQEVQTVLRVFDVTYTDFNGANAWPQVDIELPSFATNWYIPVPRPDAAYCVEVGYRTPDGRFAMLGRSNVATTPRVEASPSMTLRWMTPPGRPPSLPPSLQRPPLPFPTTAELSATASGQHPFSWSLQNKASAAAPRRINPTG